MPGCPLPTDCGEYFFGNLNIYTTSPLRLISRRFTYDNNQMVPTYPSYMQLRKYDLMAFSNNLFQYGLKKIRRIGHTMEFEQIKEYVQGDDLRTINWKATARRGDLMIQIPLPHTLLLLSGLQYTFHPCQLQLRQRTSLLGS